MGWRENLYNQSEEEYQEHIDNCLLYEDGEECEECDRLLSMINGAYDGE